MRVLSALSLLFTPVLQAQGRAFEFAETTQRAAADARVLVDSRDLGRFKIPPGVTLTPDIQYREGNPAWRLDLALPTNRSGAARPAIVFVHGGGWGGGDKRSGYFLQGALDYAAKGYVCITVNYRLTGEQPFPACVEDTRCAVRWLRTHAKKYHVDSDRIGGYGNSAGAHLVAMLALAGPDPELDGDAPYSEYSSLLQAACISAAPTDMIQFASDRGLVPTRPGALLQGPAESFENRAKKASPVYYARADAPPMLMFHGDADPTIKPHHATLLYGSLKTAGAKDITLVMVHDIGHGVFLQRSTVTKPAMEAFFGRTLKPDNRP